MGSECLSVRLSASASHMRDSAGLKKILMSTYSAGAACCDIKEEFRRNQKYLTGIRIDTGKEEENANRRYVTNFIDFSRLFFGNKDDIVAGKAQIKRAVLSFVGSDRTWADYFRNLTLWNQYVSTRGMAVIVVIGICALWCLFYLSTQLSVLSRKNQELAMQVSLLNQENEMLLKKIQEVQDAVKKESK